MKISGGFESSFSLRRQKPDLVLIAVVAIALCAAALLATQIVVLVSASLVPDQSSEANGFGVANFVQLFSSGIFVSTLANTFLLGAGSVVVMLAFALPLAWLYARTDLPRREALVFLLTTKVAVPGFLVALGYIFLFNPSNGLMNQLLQGLGLGTPFNVYTLGWVAFVQGIGLAAPCFFMLVPSFMAIDSSLEEAARVSGLNSRRVLFAVTLPLLAPAIGAATIYFFVIAMETFDYPALLGLPSRTLVASTWIFQLISQSNDVPFYGEASALGLVVSLISGGLSILYLWATRRAAAQALVTGKRNAAQRVRLSPRGRALAWGFIGIYSLFGVFIPLLILGWSSLLPFPRLPSPDAFRMLSVAAYASAVKQMSVGGALQNSLVAMVVAPTLAVVFGLCLSWVSLRSRLPGRKLTDALVVTSVAVPSIVAALAFLYAGLATYRFVPLYGTVWLVVLAMGARQTTWACRAISNAMAQIHREIEESAAVSGLRRGRVFLSILAPLLAPSLVFSWFWIALLVLRDLTMPVMINDPDTNMMSTAIWALSNAGKSGIASAMALFLLVFIVIMVAVFQRLTRALAV